MILIESRYVIILILDHPNAYIKWMQGWMQGSLSVHEVPQGSLHWASQGFCHPLRYPHGLLLTFWFPKATSIPHNPLLTSEELHNSGYEGREVLQTILMGPHGVAVWNLTWTQQSSISLHISSLTLNPSLSVHHFSRVLLLQLQFKMCFSPGQYLELQSKKIASLCCGELKRWCRGRGKCCVAESRSGFKWPPYVAQ